MKLLAAHFDNDGLKQLEAGLITRDGFVSLYVAGILRSVSFMVVVKTPTDLAQWKGCAVILGKQTWPDTQRVSHRPGLQEQQETFTKSACTPCFTMQSLSWNSSWDSWLFLAGFYNPSCHLSCMTWSWEYRCHWYLCGWDVINQYLISVSCQLQASSTHTQCEPNWFHSVD